MISALLLLLPALAAPAPIADVEALAAARVVDLALFDPALKAADPALVRAAVDALGRLQDAAALPRLEAALGHPDFEVREAAAFAWGQIEAAPPGPVASRVEAEVAPPVRVRLIEALGKLATTDRPLLLKAAEGDADPAVRRAARIALGLVARREKGAAPDLAGPLVEWLKADGDHDGAAFALRRADSLVDPGIFTATLACAQDAEADVRALCARALGRFSEAALEACPAEQGAACVARLDAALLQAAADTDWRVGVEAWRAAEQAGRLATLAPTLAEPPAWPDGPRLHVWTTALDALLAAPPLPAAEAAAKALFDRAPQGEAPGAALGRAHLRCRAAALLDRAGGDRLSACDPAAPPGLVAALTPPLLAHLAAPARAAEIARRYPLATTAILRIALLEAAASVGGEGSAAVDATLRAGLADADVAVFSQAATTAGELGATALAPLLRARLTPLRVAGELEALIATIDALAALKDADARAPLRPLLTDANAAIATAAANALTALGEPAKAAPTPREPSPVPHPGRRKATVETTKGRFTIELFGDDAPLTVQNFITLAERGFYDGLLFHRVVGDFVVQGGDPRGDGWGGPGYAIPCEIGRHPYTRGAVGMALAGKDTGGSQWFVTHSPQPHLDGRYTVFGQASDLDVVDALAVGDRILKITIERGAAGP
ncbi:MAG: peptidylprolyl isomerase [bacterium]